MDFVNKKYLYLVLQNLGGNALFFIIDGYYVHLCFQRFLTEAVNLDKGPVLPNGLPGFITCPGSYTGATDCVHSARPSLKYRTAATCQYVVWSESAGNGPETGF